MSPAFSEAGAGETPALHADAIPYSDRWQCPSDSKTTATGYGSGSSLGLSPATFHTSYIANFNANQKSIADVVNVSKTVYLSDGGTRWVDAQDPNTLAQKAGSWILEYHNSGGNAGNVTGTNADWAGPSARHLETSNVLFMDGHVKALKPVA